MLSFTNITTTLPRFAHAGATIVRRSISRPRNFPCAHQRFVQYSNSNQDAQAAFEKGKNAVKQGVNEAASTADQMTQKTKDMAQKATDTVIGKAEESKEAVKANAEKVKKCMDTKKETS